REYSKLFERIEATVLPDRKDAAEAEVERTREAVAANTLAKTNKHHANFLSNWWKLSYRRSELMQRLASIPRYVACGQVTKRSIFEFVHSAVSPNAALQVFPFAEDYSFGILQSRCHWDWFVARCSTLKGDFRYTSNTVFDSFPWPQSPSAKQVKAVAAAAVHLRDLRTKLRAKHNLSLRDLYRSSEQPGKHPLLDAHAELDASVRVAYGASATEDALAFLLRLNANCAAAEATGTPVIGPGLPPGVAPGTLVSPDAVRMP
ncbi:MAG: type IIL restriction-modification enzyme MmeI, partial [Gemmatimonadaceae bacterium]